MPSAAVIYGAGLGGTGTTPYAITVGWTEVSAASAELESITFEETGVDDPGYLRMRLWDPTNSLIVTSQMVVRVHDNTLGAQVYLGVVLNHDMDVAALGRYINVEAVSVGALLDEILVPNEPRPAESDAARVSYLWGAYAKYPLDPDQSQVTQTNAAVSADLMAGMTLRAALDQTAGLAGTSTHYHVDSVGRLVWRTGNSAVSAPYNINVAQAPGGGNIAPNDLTVQRDGTLKNRLYIRGSNPLGSGWFQDAASVAQYGAREEFIDAPSADTAAKAQTIALLQLGRVAQPNIRAAFSTNDPNSGWRADQNITVTSAQHDLAATALKIVRVTTTFLSGTGTRAYKVEAGATGARLSGIPAIPVFVPPDVGQPSFVVRNRLMFINEQGIIGPGYVAASAGGGLMIVSNDGTTVIIDGSSNMFKIVATGTFTQSALTNTTASATLTFGGLGLPASDAPAFVAFVTEGLTPASNANRNSGYFANTQTGFVASTSGGSPTQRMKYINYSCEVHSNANASVPTIVMAIENPSAITVDFYVRVHILKETAV